MCNNRTRFWIINWTHVQRNSVVVSGRIQIDQWKIKRKKILVDHFLMKCLMRQKELQDKTSNKALRRPGMCRTIEKN
ncbi:hypothetical protein DPMN_013021 [Dreissena polymorpha]|uniref:Uncharacterized protein n=1 Tax=Dreissena polymorpha TaxID=45954 RepID=A0A9D4S205_DREPO|nr:hypothetical protein DPMN_013021 [Dreissena polymorpha]